MYERLEANAQLRVLQTPKTARWRW